MLVALCGVTLIVVSCEAFQTMSQRQQLERILEIDRRIRNRAFPNPDQLAKDLGVKRRTIYDDRTFMIDRLKAPIAFDRTQGGWYYSDENWVFPGIMVSEGELLAFLLSVEVAKRYLGTSLEKTLRTAVERLSRNIQGSVTVDLEALRSNYSFTSPTLLSVNESAWLDLERAIGQFQKVWMRYYTASRNEHTERIVHPYHLSNVRGDWYLIAYDELRKGIRNFSIGRIEEWRLLDDRFSRDPQFLITDYLQTAFQAEHGSETVEIAIRFSPQAARYVRERSWHNSQIIEDQPDGSLLFRLRTSGLGEIKRWVLQYGGEAEVIEPENLRETIKMEARQMLRLYQ